MNDLDWKPPTVTDEELRAAGFTANARKFPRSRSAAQWIADFNGIPFEKIPAAWCYASNEYMYQYVEDQARKSNQCA